MRGLIQYWKWRRLRKAAHNLLYHARHIRLQREDVEAPEAIRRLVEAESELRRQVAARNPTSVDTAMERTLAAARAVTPVRRWPSVRENVEVIVVAVAVAMAFRTYLLQPFKIPTGSMQPTLYGIHYVPSVRTWLDTYPVRVAKWALTGRWRTEFRAQSTGNVTGPYLSPDGRGTQVYEIGGVGHPIPRELQLRIKPGEYVIRGQIIAAGDRIIGDHILVDKVSWNFVKPTRGEVMVFSTEGIPALQLKRTHYIKRMVGLPGDSIQIRSPDLMVNGQVVTNCPPIQRVASRTGGYAGYLPTGQAGDYLGSPRDVITLRADQYLAMGDNTQNSYDGRYWGPVPRNSLVGPARFVYWPLSARTGRIR